MSRSDLVPPRRASKATPDAIASGAAGFALIEILVAFTIALLALGMLYRISSSGLAIGTTAVRYSRALLIAETALDEVGVETPLAPGQSARQVDGAYDQDVTVLRRPDLVPGAAALPGAFPYQVSVQVSWDEAGRARSIELSTIRLGPVP
jgi:general secretion pathway protein I